MENKKTDEALNAEVAVENEALGDAAYAQYLPDFMALKPEELIVINVDVPTVVATVIGSLPEIRALSAEIQKAMPELDLATINKLKAYALALSYAHALYLSADSPSSVLQQLVEAGTTLRETLLLDATTLARRNLIDAGKLSELQGVVGFKNLAIDLTILASVLKDRWAEIQSKCAVTAAELEEALRLAERIFTEVGLKEQGPAAVAFAVDMRLRVFTVLARLYDLVRQGVSFVRWKHSDAEKIAPSLYAGRGRRRATSDNASTEPVTPPPAVPVPPAGSLPGSSGTNAPKALNAPASSAGASSAHKDPFLP